MADTQPSTLCLPRTPAPIPKLRPAPQARAPLRPRQYVDPAFQEFLAVIRRRSSDRRFFHFLLQHRVHERLQRSLRFSLRYARLEPPKRIHPAGPPVRQHLRITNQDLLLHHHRDKNLRGVSQLHAVKSRLRHPDNRHFVLVDQHSFPDDLPVAAKALPPEVIAQHHQRVAVRHTVILRRERAAQRSAHSQDTKVRPRNQFRRHTFRLRAKRHAHRLRKPAEHPRKNFVVILKIAVHRVRNRVPAPVVPVVPPPHGQQHQPLRILHWQQAQQHLVQQRENRRVRANPQRQSQRRHQRKPPATPQSPQRVPKIPPHHLRPPTHLHPTPPTSTFPPLLYLYAMTTEQFHRSCLPGL